MKARLISIMLWAPDDWSDDAVARVCLKVIDDHFLDTKSKPTFSKAITVPDDQVSYKAAIIFGETIRPEGEGRGE